MLYLVFWFFEVMFAIKVLNKKSSKCSTTGKVHFASCLFKYNCSSQLCEHKQKLHVDYLTSWQILKVSKLLLLLLLLRLGRFCHQILSAVVWSMSTVSSSRAAKPSVPFGGWYKEQKTCMWSAVCSYAPHLQFAEDTKPHLGIMSTASTWRSLEIESPTQASVDTMRMLPGW